MSILSDRAKKFVRKVLGVDEDRGPEPPARLREQVIAFANMLPDATRFQWIEFAAGFASEAWEAGYLAGVEWAEREPRDGPDPEAFADEADPTWRERPWRPGILVEGDDSKVTEEPVDETARLREEVIRLRAKPRRM